MSTQRLGAVGAILFTGYFALLLLTILVVMPAQGFTPSAENFHDPAVAIPFARRSMVFPEYYVIALLFAVGLVCVGIASYERMSAQPLMRFALAAAIIGAALALLECALGLKVLPEIVDLYASQPQEAGAAYLAVNLLTGGTRVGSWHAYGWWALLTSIAGLRAGLKPRHLWYAGIGAGLIGIATLFIDIALINAVVWLIIWPLWFALSMIGEKSTQP